MITAVLADWELDYYSRPVLEPDGKKRWELLICSSPALDRAEPFFRWHLTCPAGSVNSAWLKGALDQALAEASAQGFAPPRRLRCWRGSMRTMVQRAAEQLGLDVIPSRRCYALVEWLQERQRSVYPQEPGFLAGPLAPPPTAIQPLALPLPETVRGDSWDWATIPLGDLRDAAQWPIGFSGLVALPEGLDPAAPVQGVRLFSRTRALAIAGWLAGLEPVRLEITGEQLVLEAGIESRWLLANLGADEAAAATQAFRSAREQAGGVQFIAVQASVSEPRLEGFWLLRDLPDP
ncbi:Tab2/Atab2 family RNA-binding protein [Cyanobium sp. Morenito 9A2]|uniref:Tab2/Atab2 family RNA-binding protein n=1 Tax=Cyanobium sp. Morenito 9A2 TaxID=2823718 RepID=UPI0020CE713F|nr:Tab2/Atab2 family RNA-binding protein [Cyanobium sp. Morenito 9A2]MCP9849307.1 Tab2/Atab2 family RNA-binding protein [Cyanobium sp. Morenito 9A2]